MATNNIGRSARESDTVGTPQEGVMSERPRVPATGGAMRGRMAAMSPSDATATSVTNVIEPHDRVNWGSVWAGLLTVFTIFLVLELLAYGLGWMTIGSGANLTTSGVSGWFTGLFALIAFFVGGYLAGNTSAVQGRLASSTTGFILWALGISLILGLSILGLGTLFGSVGNVVGQFLASGRSVNTGGISVNGNAIAQISRSASLGAFVTLVVTAIVAIVGSMIGAEGGRLVRR